LHRGDGTRAQAAPSRCEVLRAKRHLAHLAGVTNGRWTLAEEPNVPSARAPRHTYGVRRCPTRAKRLGRQRPTALEAAPPSATAFAGALPEGIAFEASGVAVVVNSALSLATASSFVTRAFEGSAPST